MHLRDKPVLPTMTRAALAAAIDAAESDDAADVRALLSAPFAPDGAQERLDALHADERLEGYPIPMLW